MNTILRFPIGKLSARVLGATAAIILAMSSPAAQTFPNQPVRLVVGASPGGSVDGMARLLAKSLSEAWGQPVIVENKPGVAGLLAAEQVSKAPNDGHTLALVLDNVFNSVPFMTAKLSINPLTDLKPIALVATFPLVLVANPNLPYKTVTELVQQAKTQPGKIDYASSGVGSSGHITMAMLEKAAGVSLNHIPYKGGIPALHDVMAGHAPMLWSSLTPVLPALRAGSLTVLGAATKERMPLLPNVPTLSEQGFPGFVAGNWLAIMGPPRLPDAIADKIHAGVVELTAKPAYRNYLVENGFEPVVFGARELAARIQSEHDSNKELFKSLGIGPQ